MSIFQSARLASLPYMFVVRYLLLRSIQHTNSQLVISTVPSHPQPPALRCIKRQGFDTFGHSLQKVSQWIQDDVESTLVAIFLLPSTFFSSHSECTASSQLCKWKWPGTRFTLSHWNAHFWICWEVGTA